MPDVHKNFIEPLLTQFRIPPDVKPENIDGFFGDYVEALVYCNKDGELIAYDDDVLRAAARKLKTERTGSRTFPMPAECIEACKAVWGQMLAVQIHAERHEQHAEWSQARRQFADGCMNSDLGRQAAEEGWIWALWDFCRESSRMPNGIEAQMIRTRSMANAAEYKQMLSTSHAATPTMRKWIKMRDAAMTRLRGLAYA